ncbi:MAG TPA: glycosyltransferase family 4 protein [Candidatus Eremiobacteraceae bacterium]|nr:glycosyltransferase family 4 protein [Candidatus Eremiobacteraceae bacterium]
MRILYCNKYNYPFSGTEVYLFEAMELMRSKGHEVALFSMADARGQTTPYDHNLVPPTDFKRPAGWFHKSELAARAIYSSEARRRMRAMIDEFQPDVAHVRNIYHHLSPSILWELKAKKIPVVYHLNDFKVLCPSYNLVLRGEACETCKGGKFWHALTKKCYPGWGARMTLVAEAYVHKWVGTYQKCVDCFLAPSQFVRDKFVEHGWDPTKFEVLPHFQLVAAVDERATQNAPLLYFGRLSPEKGLGDLLHAMQRLPNLRLIVAGDGPERGRLQQLASDLELANVEFVGHIAGAELDRAIANACFTVLPSHAYETLGKTILESYARGRAVLATDLGSRREFVQAGKTGLLYKTGDVDELVSAIQFLSAQPELADKMGRTGHDQVRRGYTPDAHYAILSSLYRRLADGKGQSSMVSGPGKFQTIPIAPRAPTGFLRIHRDGFIPLHHLALAPVSRDSVNLPAAMRPKRMLRVAFIGGRGVVSKYSGIETYYEEVGQRLAGMGHQVTAYCRSYFTPPGKEHNGMQTVRLPTIRSKHMETVLHTFLSTLHVLMGPCDIVHYHALGPALFSFIPRLAGKKTVVTVQGLDWQRKKWGRAASIVLRLGERAAVGLPSHTMVVSRQLQKHYRAGYAAETSYVPNGGVLREWSVPKKILEWDIEPGRYILFLGRFSPEKGCHLLVEAYEKLDTDVKLVMAGAASYCDDYSRGLLAHASKRIKVLDWVAGDVLDELLTNAMIFVLPSDLEGLSLALLDAMGAGLCVLGSDVAENREAIDDAGFTFRRGDVADLADRLRFLIANPVVREAAGQAAKRRVREYYQWPEIAAEIERVYYKMMGWELAAMPPRKAAGKVAEAIPSMQRRTG